MTVPLNDLGPLDLGLLALRDCGVVQADSYHPIYYQLTSQWLATRRALPSPRGRVAHYRITDRGRRCLARKGFA
jgi:hypothetical protein